MSVNTPESSPSILIVDDDDALRDQLSRAFRRRGYDVAAAASYGEAVKIAEAREFRQAVVDLRMPGPSGMELLQKLRQICPTTQVVMLTGFGSIANAMDAIRLGAVNYVAKPAHADDIIAAFERSVESTKKTSSVDGSQDSTPSLAQAEWEHIQRVLADCDGNISQAAFELGISRRSLQRKLRKLAP